MLWLLRNLLKILWSVWGPQSWNILGGRHSIKPYSTTKLDNKDARERKLFTFAPDVPWPGAILAIVEQPAFYKGYTSGLRAEQIVFSIYLREILKPILFLYRWVNMELMIRYTLSILWVECCISLFFFFTSTYSHFQFTIPPYVASIVHTICVLFHTYIFQVIFALINWSYLLPRRKHHIPKLYVLYPSTPQESRISHNFEICFQ